MDASPALSHQVDECGNRKQQINATKYLLAAPADRSANKPHLRSALKDFTGTVRCPDCNYWWSRSTT